VRAALLLRRETGCRRGARISLLKRIPAGAGLGGGSSDAAAALAGLDRLWRLGLPASRLRALGARLGSDVPFFLEGARAAVGTGRGERLRPVPSRLRAWAVILKPSFGVSTREAYAAFDRLPPSRRPRPSAPLSACVRAVRSGNLRALAPHNDFEAAVFPAHPRLARLRSSLLSAGASAAFMTGSGSAMVGLFASRSHARRAASALGRRLRAWSACVPLVTHPA
jgi:4-diphosphocytidyl-2-C-methyl-D-erythritol kinase